MRRYCLVGEWQDDRSIGNNILVRGSDNREHAIREKTHVKKINLARSFGGLEGVGECRLNVLVGGPGWCGVGAHQRRRFVVVFFRGGLHWHHPLESAVKVTARAISMAA